MSKLLHFYYLLLDTCTGDIVVLSANSTDLIIGPSSVEQGSTETVLSISANRTDMTFMQLTFYFTSFVNKLTISFLSEDGSTVLDDAVSPSHSYFLL